MNDAASSKRGNFRQKLESFFTTVERERIWMAFGAALFVACLFYRAGLAARIYFGSEQPFSLQPAQVPVGAFLKCLLMDWLVIMFVSMVCLGAKSWLRWRAPRFVEVKLVRYGEVALAAVILFLFALILRAHAELLFELETGLTVTLVVMSPTLFGVTDFLHLFAVGDVLFLATPLVAFVLFFTFAKWLRWIYRPTFVGFTLVVVLVQLPPSPKKLSADLRENPVQYLIADVLKAPLRAYFGKANPYQNNSDLPGEAQLRSIRLIDAAFVTNAAPASLVSARSARPAEKPWNILFFVLESTGADYVFDTSQGNELPMPFLHRMAEEGLQLANHHATCNSSPSAAFSIFTGLYPRPTREPFSLSKTAALPTINSYLATNYDCFLVHPSSLTYCFPTELLINNHFTELNSQQNLPPGKHADVCNLARNEKNGVDFLMERLDRAREPFLGVYWSFIPHHPYSDYGPEYRIRPNLKNKRDLYYNNLRALDVQLRRVCEHLAQTGLLERTVLVFVGDHGEAFGQHPSVWVHSFGSYSEMYRTPMVFWQPRLIAPGVVTIPTSHADILPTLLDLLGLPYDEARFQGESMLRGQHRKYIFSMDAQADYLSAIDRQMNKVTLNFNHGSPLIFNLAKDSGERLPLSEDKFSEQIEAILKFRNYQTRMINDYNAAVLADQEFPPETAKTKKD